MLANPVGEMHLSHAERIDRVQRRRYYRGEARFYALDDRYQRGESVEMTFHPDSQQAMHLVGRIVRESHGGRVVHVQYTDVRPSTRDRVLGLLFRRGGRAKG